MTRYRHDNPRHGRSENVPVNHPLVTKYATLLFLSGASIYTLHDTVVALIREARELDAPRVCDGVAPHDNECPVVTSYAQCQGCKTRWKQRLEERDENGAVTVVGYYVVGPCRLCGMIEYVYEWETMASDPGAARMGREG